MKFFVPIAQAAIIAALSWLMVSVQQLKTDVAVLKWAAGVPAAGGGSREQLPSSQLAAQKQHE